MRLLGGRLAPLLLAAVLAGCVPPARAPAAVTTVVVVRHAERVSMEDRDSPLSAAGEARARALAESLADAGVSALYATQYRRTQQTLAPLAALTGLPVVVREIDDAESYARALRAEILASHPGGTVVVAGHSDSVPALVRSLGGVEVGPIPDDRYGDLYVVAIRPGAASTLRARFGAGR